MFQCLYVCSTAETSQEEHNYLSIQIKRAGLTLTTKKKLKFAVLAVKLISAITIIARENMERAKINICHLVRANSFTLNTQSVIINYEAELMEYMHYRIKYFCLIICRESQSCKALKDI